METGAPRLSVRKKEIREFLCIQTKQNRRIRAREIVIRVK
jgi:hypothetical protein